MQSVQDAEVSIPFASRTLEDAKQSVVNLIYEIMKEQVPDPEEIPTFNCLVDEVEGGLKINIYELDSQAVDSQVAWVKFDISELHQEALEKYIEYFRVCIVP